MLIKRLFQIVFFILSFKTTVEVFFFFLFGVKLKVVTKTFVYGILNSDHVESCTLLLHCFHLLNELFFFFFFYAFELLFFIVKHDLKYREFLKDHLNAPWMISHKSKALILEIGLTDALLKKNGTVWLTPQIVMYNRQKPINIFTIYFHWNVTLPKKITLEKVYLVENYFCQRLFFVI